jgi:hypothetical protein
MIILEEILDHLYQIFKYLLATKLRERMGENNPHLR